MSKKIIICFELEIDRQRYKYFKDRPQPLLFVKETVTEEAVGLIAEMPNIEKIEHAKGFMNQTEEWIEKGKGNCRYMYVKCKKLTKSEFETYSSMKVLPVLRYAFHLKPPTSLLVLGFI